MSITYCKPYKKGRVIFGAETDDALQPYGEYWRTGANESTEVTFEQDVIFNGETVKAGTYRFYTVPGEKEWTVALNTELGVWGAYEPDYSLDIHKSKVMVEKTPEETEQFTMSYDPQDNHVNIVLNWDKTMVKIPVSPAS
jgi:flagellar basal body rod protein FlgC